MSLINNFLNKITIYRLVLYCLISFLGVAVVFCFFGLLPFSPINLVFSTVFLVVICWVTNRIFAKIFNAQTNLESSLITALILTLIITPINSYLDLPFLAAAGILAVASKYILAINKKHIFNPAAFSAVLMALVFHKDASWWVGNSYMLIPIVMGGLLVIKKLRRFSMVLTFAVVYAIFVGPQVFQTILESPIFFFAYIMLTEPQTTPPTKRLQMLYGGLVGLGGYYLTLETTLILGNIFSYLVSPKIKLLLKLKEKIQIAPDTYDFIFKLDKPLTYKPGQYMEWTLGHTNPDSRGTRRYFTLASSPAEGNLRIGIKLYPNPSSYKKSLLSKNIGDQIVASLLSGEFTLPKDINKKLCFIAGGIGITPFRSMIKFLCDINQKRDIILLYSNKTAKEIVYKRSLKGNFQDELSRFPYKDIFDEAFKKFGTKIVYVNTDTVGYIDEKMIREEVSDFKDRTFYISGPHSMVDVFEKTLKGMGVVGGQIKVDFFPGYA